MKINLSDIRQEYKKASLSEKHISKNPVDQFESWLKDAIESHLPEPTGMIISTVDENCRPSSRTVLLKGIDNGKFTFYTNYHSRKGRNLEKNPYICATFLWKELERQVHIEGKTEKVPANKSDEYFHSRPWASQVGARISPQSYPIKSRNTIKIAFAKEALKFTGREVPRPENWGGFYIVPDRMEFWQGRPSRLHDRIVFTLLSDGTWKIQRLAP